MANERYGNKYVVLLGHETSYGTKQTTPTGKVYCSCTMKETTNQIETNIKNNDTERWKEQLMAGTKSATVTLSGELSLEDTTTSNPVGYGTLIAAFFSDADAGAFEKSDYVNPAAASGESFTIYQYATSDSFYDCATGCVAESLEITGSTGEAITFNMTFRAKGITREVEDTGDNALDESVDTTYANTKPLLFHNATLTTCLGESNLSAMNSFTISLTNSYADDNLLYNNTQTKSMEVLCGFTGNLTVELNYDSTNSSDIYDNIMSTALKSCVIKLTESGGTKYWQFTTNGKVTDFDKPDPDKCIFTNSYTKELLGDSGTAAITMAYAAS